MTTNVTTTTLFAALNVLDGTVIGQNMKRHRHREFIRFLNAIEAQVPKRKAIHAIVDNYATHKTPRSALADPPSALDLPLHADLGLLAQRGRGVLRQGHAPVRMTWLGSEAISTAIDFDQ